MAQRKTQSDTQSVPTDDPRFVAAVRLLGHTGALGFQIRYDDAEMPVVWNAVCWYDATKAGGYAHFFDKKAGKHVHAKVAAGMSPTAAVLALCDEVIDGGKCTHCGRPSGFNRDTDDMPMDELICWYQWDPELQVFRRGCAGDVEEPT